MAEPDPVRALRPSHALTADEPSTSDGPGRLGALDLAESARRIGHYTWIETKLFETLGAWTAAVPEPHVKLLLGTHCHKHAWHAALWFERLPVMRDSDPARYVVPPNDALVAFVNAIDAPSGAGATVERLAGVYRVLVPRIVAAYTHHLAVASEVSDGPTIRALRLALADEIEDWCEGEALVQSLLVTPDDVDRAGTHQARLEKLIVAAGGITGPVSVPTSTP